MLQLDKVSSLRETVMEWKRAGQRVALVPTMGNLHAGHLSLVDKARQKADRVVVSVFVNPLQFGPNEDFDRYPRTYEQDCAYLREKRVDAVFAPSVEEMYPNGQEQTLVVAPSHLTTILEGATRPGHFDGVTTVVNKLFNMVQPDVAVFGQKDFQQVAVLKRMVEDLSMPVELIRAEIMRDADGLALSSRNQYLDEAQRRIAPKLFVVLQSVRMAIESENDDFRALEATATQQLLAEGFDAVDYVNIRQTDSLEPVDSAGENCVIVAAARLGKTRLLDNVLVAPH
ncbi:pantoate--beta-alanine ligase [Hydrogenovibrio thermophilus]|uniref:Pantothenate synthetase n=1 Tax=Hydrogenovibrio thermophilus TaxID=265883 RepID=A0A410H3Y5_9GAMM|nr:pantoate--beta-alanine ligase [Hydrogenovibrio thermophilus]QAB15648.1 pantoate--beta-alanine ligase [Hydrogenovibrio thermophilus]